MVVEQISDFIQTGYTAKRKDDHFNPLDDKTSASGVRRKSPSCWNVLSTWEQGAGQLCKWWKDGLTEQLHCDEVTSDSQMLLSATVTLTMLMWGVGDAWAAEAEQEMIRNTGGKNPCWAYLADFFERKALWATSLSRTRGEQHLLRFTFVVGDITGASRARKGLASNILKLYLQTIFVIRFKPCLRCEVVLGGSLVKQRTLPNLSANPRACNYGNHCLCCTHWSNRCTERLAETMLTTECSILSRRKRRWWWAGIWVNTHTSIRFSFI